MNANISIELAAERKKERIKVITTQDEILIENTCSYYRWIDSTISVPRNQCIKRHSVTSYSV